MSLNQYEFIAGLLCVIAMIPVALLVHEISTAIHDTRHRGAHRTSGEHPRVVRHHAGPFNPATCTACARRDCICTDGCATLPILLGEVHP